MYHLTIPLVNRKGKSQGQLARWVDGGKSTVIPRIGELISIAPEIQIEVVSVSYGGTDLQMVYLVSEPISDEFKDSFLRTTFGKKKNIWSWSK